MKKAGLVLSAVFFLCAVSAHAQYTVLHSFAGNPGDGAYPSDRPALVGSTLYGVASQGGGGGCTSGCGVLFSLDPSAPGSYGIVHAFNSGVPNDGISPTGGPLAVGNMLYGMTQRGGSANYGTIYSLDPSVPASYAILHSFNSGVPNDGRLPSAGLVSDGTTLYGMTPSGGTGPGYSGSGVVFSVDPANPAATYTILHNFAGSPTDGARPRGPLLLDDSTLYGVTGEGGKYPSSAGTIFSMNKNGGGYTILHHFDGLTGASPIGGLVSDNSMLYGTTYGLNYGIRAQTRESNSMGSTVFAMDKNGSGFTVLHEFEGGSSDGTGPWGDLVLEGGTLYGTTGGGGAPLGGQGTLFAVDTDGSGYRLIHNFSDGLFADGAYPAGGLVSDGSTLYGAAYDGGNYGYGVAFSLVIPPPPAEIVLNGATFGAGDPFTATFKLNDSVTRAFTAYAVLILPGGAMLNATTLDTPLRPVASNVPGLAAPFSYPLLSVTVPGGVPAGTYEIVAAFFDPAQPITGRDDAFLEASRFFTVQ